ncbi:hypothetical protein Csa_010859 [Cucumis sativus]|uniref:Uncharacterized protein n=1 Tax=Cucumis sativus TaxID=3659 RepID=A0A0A0L5Z8_CUCSA|nr:hypothetical protein Csa_010859 [Cucumis sativus]
MAKALQTIVALNKCDHDTHLIAAVAKLFWHYRKVDIARTWLNRAVILASGVGVFTTNSNFSRVLTRIRRNVLKRYVDAEPKQLRNGKQFQRLRRTSIKRLKQS